MLNHLVDTSFVGSAMRTTGLSRMALSLYIYMMFGDLRHT